MLRRPSSGTVIFSTTCALTKLSIGKCFEILVADCPLKSGENNVCDIHQIGEWAGKSR